MKYSDFLSVEQIASLMEENTKTLGLNRTDATRAEATKELYELYSKERSSYKSKNKISSPDDVAVYARTLPVGLHVVTVSTKMVPIESFTFELYNTGYFNTLKDILRKVLLTPRVASFFIIHVAEYKKDEKRDELIALAKQANEEIVVLGLSVTDVYEYIVAPCIGTSFRECKWI